MKRLCSTEVTKRFSILFCSTEKTGSYFPGFPAYSIVPGPDRHRVSYRPGNSLGLLIDNPFNGFKDKINDNLYLQIR